MYVCPCKLVMVPRQLYGYYIFDFGLNCRSDVLLSCIFYYVAGASLANCLNSSNSQDTLNHGTAFYVLPLKVSSL